MISGHLFASLFCFKRNCEKILRVNLFSLILLGKEAEGLGKCILKLYVQGWGMEGAGSSPGEAAWGWGFGEDFYSMFS